MIPFRDRNDYGTSAAAIFHSVVNGEMHELGATRGGSPAK
jgi:hypothetical protein